MIPNDIGELVAPWERAQPGFEVELQREVGPEHPLFGVEAVSVARRSDNDDVLFALSGAPQPLTVVHLTWSGRREPDPCPWTEFYTSWQDWAERRMKPDHQEFEEIQPE